MRVGSLLARRRLVEACLAAAVVSLVPAARSGAEPFTQASGNQPSLAGKDYGKTVRVWPPHVHAQRQVVVHSLQEDSLQSGHASCDKS